MANKKLKYSAEQRVEYTKQTIRLREAGVGWKTISDKLNVSGHTVQRWFKVYKRHGFDGLRCSQGESYQYVVAYDEEYQYNELWKMVLSGRISNQAA